VISAGRVIWLEVAGILYTESIENNSLNFFGGAGDFRSVFTFGKNRTNFILKPKDFILKSFGEGGFCFLSGVVLLSIS
jgi:hypothetical protein